MQRAFKHDDVQVGFEIALGAANRGGSDVGEVLATAGRIHDKDADAWVREWTATADAVRADAETAGNGVSALAHLLRAATYYSTALDLVDHSRTYAPQRLDIWKRQRACWERVVDLMPVPGERMTVRDEDTTLPAWVFRAPDAAPGERRPLVAMTAPTGRPS
jgi:hypothetical protein